MADWLANPPLHIEEYLTDSQEEITESGWDLMTSQMVAVNRIQELAAEALNGAPPGEDHRSLLGATLQEDRLGFEDPTEEFESSVDTLDGSPYGTGDDENSQPGFEVCTSALEGLNPDANRGLEVPSQTGNPQNAASGAVDELNVPIPQAPMAPNPLSEAEPPAVKYAARGIPSIAPTAAVLTSALAGGVTSAPAPIPICEIEECHEAEDSVPLVAVPGSLSPSADNPFVRSEGILGKGSRAPVRSELQGKMIRPQMRSAVTPPLAQPSPGTFPRAPAPANPESDERPGKDNRASPEPRQRSFVEDEFARQRELFEATSLRGNASCHKYKRWASFAFVGAAVARVGGYVMLAAAAQY